MGYKDATSGRSRRALAALRQFGLITAPKDGYVAISRQLETYKVAPDDPTKRALLLEFFRSRAIYKTPISKFPDRLPSDAALKYEFIQLGFVPNGVEEEVRIFKQSAEFSGAYGATGMATGVSSVDDPGEVESEEPSPKEDSRRGNPQADESKTSIGDRIPIRLTGGRKAVLEVPMPFYEADKRIIKSVVSAGRR